MKNFVELENGQLLSLSSLAAQVPRNCFIGELHLDVCERWLNRIEPPAEVRKTYLNLLFVKSKQLRELTALIVLIRQHKLQVRRVVSDYVDSAFADLFGTDIAIECSGERTNVLRATSFLRFMLKVCCHQLYRVFGSNKVNKKSVVRAWVDTTDHTYPDEVERELLLIYPFTTNWLRQAKYLWRCYRRQRNYRITAIPYRLADCCSILFHWHRRDIELATREQRAYAKHGEALVAAGISLLFSGDEFEMAGHALHEVLLNNGVQTINRAHGIGVYGPCVRYGRASFFNSQQRKFYARRGVIDEVACQSFELAAHRYAATDENYQPVVTYIQGNWSRRRQAYEWSLEARLLTVLSQLCRAQDLPFLVKPHPNVGALRQHDMRRRYGVKIISAFDQLSGRHPIFINLCSTAFYACMNYGPSVFIADELLDPRSYFGTDIHLATIDELATKLQCFSSPAAWNTAYNKAIAV